MKMNHITISLTNTKLGASIPSINLPPIITCRQNAPCSHLCYACKGNFKYPNVKKSHTDNLAFYIVNPEEYFKEIQTFLNDTLVSYKYFRYHASGDIPNKQYLELMCKTAKKCKHVKFLAFTKKFELINKFIEENGEKAIPSNLHIVFSMWNKDYKVENPYDFPTTWVNFKDKKINPEIPELAIPCTGKCYECQACWQLKKGQSVVFNQH